LPPVADVIVQVPGRGVVPVDVNAIVNVSKKLLSYVNAIVLESTDDEVASGVISSAKVVGEGIDIVETSSTPSVTPAVDPEPLVARAAPAINIAATMARTVNIFMILYSLKTSIPCGRLCRSPPPGHDNHPKIVPLDGYKAPAQIPETVKG